MGDGLGRSAPASRSMRARGALARVGALLAVHLGVIGIGSAIWKPIPRSVTEKYLTDDEEYIEMAEEKCPPRFALLGIELGLQAPPPHRATRHRLRAPPSRPSM